MTSLRDQYSPSEIGFEDLTYNDWDQIERVLLTHQYGIFDQYMFDLINTRQLTFFLSLFEVKINCLKDLKESSSSNNPFSFD